MSDEVWDTLVELFGKPRTSSTRTLYGKVRKELVEAEYTRAEMLSAAHEYRRQWPHITLTISAYLKWIDHFSAQSQPPAARPEAEIVSIEDLRRMQEEK